MGLAHYIFREPQQEFIGVMIYYEELLDQEYTQLWKSQNAFY